MTPNNTITERCELLEGGLVLTATGKLAPLARPLPADRRPARHLVPSNRRSVRIAKALRAAA